MNSWSLNPLQTNTKIQVNKCYRLSDRVPSKLVCLNLPLNVMVLGGRALRTN